MYYFNIPLLIIDPHEFTSGGYDGRGGSYFNDLWRMDLDRNEWQCEPCDGIKPQPRTDHTLVEYQKDSMILFGGYDGKSRYSDVHIFSTVTKNWQLVKATGEIPSRRFGHSAVCDDER